MSIRTLRTIITVFFVCVSVFFTVYRVRLYMRTDTVAPVITAESDSFEASVSITDEELMAGMTAEDNLDGDVTKSMVIATKSKFIKKGTLRVNYAAFDKNNNVGVYARELTFTDYESPKFIITMPMHLMSGDSRQNILDYVKAQDCLDGDITSQIMYTLGDKRMTSDTASVQKLNLQVSNSAGDTALLELDLYYDDYDSYYTSAPYLSNYVYYVKVGERPDYISRVAGIWSGGGVRSFDETRFQESDIRVDSSKVDLNTPGAYPVVYRLVKTNASGNREFFGVADLIVIVEE